MNTINNIAYGEFWKRGTVLRGVGQTQGFFDMNTCKITFRCWNSFCTGSCRTSVHCISSGRSITTQEGFEKCSGQRDKWYWEEIDEHI